MQKRQSGRPRGLMGSGPSSVPSDTHPGCSGARGHTHLRRASDQFSYNPFPSSTPAQLLGAECCRFERSFGHKCFVPLSGTGQWTKSSPSFSFGSGHLLSTQPLPLPPPPQPGSALPQESSPPSSQLQWGTWRDALGLNGQRTFWGGPGGVPPSANTTRWPRAMLNRAWVSSWG